MTDIDFVLDGMLEDLSEKQRLKCKCGHMLYQHAHMDHYDPISNARYFRVLQCAMCDCKEFENEN